ncbi:response regulator [Bacillus solimangrovi]|uniref:DNA-binding response regulator n=1 Tax=Bacillus solimangrovi TaxID=1305675 RepID=A0A1E5LIB1_9BACI|nr:response regulator [Bacillus solimangrovi]OEH93824.1 hypothetical protein BFG57_10905 [Bacillus solimangrovi]
MTRILIAEDEEIERIALKKMIEDNVPHIDIVSVASNGNEAVQQALEHKPDLILMDIQMPGIDGLTAIEQILEQHSSTKMVIVSSYDTFSYAQKAIRLGVKDYLLKPSKKQVILETIEGIVKEIEDQKKMQSHMDQVAPLMETEIVTQLLFDHLHEVQVKQLLDYFEISEESKMFVLSISIMAMDREMSQAERNELYKVIKETFHNVSKGWVGALSSLQLPIISFVPDKQANAHKKHALAIIRKLKNATSKWKDVKIFIGVGGVSEGMSHLKNSYHEALRASLHIESASGFCFYSDLDNEQKEIEHSLIKIERSIIEALERDNYDQIKEMVIEMIEAGRKLQKNIKEIQNQIQQAFFMMYRHFDELGLQIGKHVFSHTITNYRQLRTETAYQISAILKEFEEKRSERQVDTASKIKEYIHKTYKSELSLEVLAEKMKLSPQYISKIFKDKYGLSYIDYLTQCRIEKAKEYIRQGEKSLKEIALDIGYKDPNYFSRVFKKMCQMSPTDYRNKYKS